LLLFAFRSLQIVPVESEIWGQIFILDNSELLTNVKVVGTFRIVKIVQIVWIVDIITFDWPVDVMSFNVQMKAYSAENRLIEANFSWWVTTPKYLRGFPHIQQEQTVLFFARWPGLLTYQNP